jgi:cytochrome P450/protoporphyrinogen oxidase
VVGAGPAGLSIARELEQAGHRAIVLEALPEVGGKCESIEIDDLAYDLGGHVCTTQYENVARLATELGMATEDTTPHRVYDIDRRDSAPQSAAFFRRETFGRYAALRETEFPKIAEPGLAHSARALARPVSEWLAEHSLEAMAESLGTGYTAAGYGYLAGDLPALYFVKYAEMTGLLSARPELLGHPGSFTIVGGFKGLWEKVAAGLSDVRCGVAITAIERDPDRDTGGVRVRTDRGDVVADDLVLTVPIDQLLPVLDATPEELDLAGRVRHLDYYTTVVSASSLPHSAFYLVDEYTRAEAGRGHAVAFHHRYPDRDVYACYSYGPDGLDGDGIVDRLREDVERMGGELGEVHTQRRWKFLPHFGGADIRDGVYDRIEHQQGRHHTYHAGSLPAYELVECTVAYSRELVRQHFGAEDVFGHSAAVVEGPRPVVDRPHPTVDALRDWLVEHIAAELRARPEAIAPDARLDSLALESISVAALQSGLSDWLGFRIPLGQALAFTNPPHHTRLRKLVSKAFTPRTVEAMRRPRIQEIADNLLDRIGEAGGGELISQVAYPLPATVIMDFIGVPEPDHARMTFLATQLMKLLGAQYAAEAPAIARAAYEAMKEFTAYLSALIAERRAEPRDDLLSTLIAATGPEGGLTDEELILNCMALLNAGLETTANYLGNGTLALLRNPAQLRLLGQSPALAESAAEELLRYDGPTPILTPQLAADDVEIGGQLIRKGQLLYPVIGAANRDPARFPDPERLDLSRPPNGQLSFGFGIHFCIGAALARIEGQVLFPTMARRFPHLRLDRDAPAPTFRDDPVLRGLNALAVRVD